MKKRLARKISILLCLCAGITAGQKLTVIAQSGYRHNYVVGSLSYIEDLRDTSRLKYIADIRITDRRQPFLQVAPWLDLIEIKATELGANAFAVTRFTEDSASVAVDVRIWFAGEPFLKANTAKRLTNSLVLFSQVRNQGDSGDFYLDDVHIRFDSQKHHRLALESGRQYLLKNNTEKITARKIIFKKPRAAEFYIIPVSKRSLDFTWMQSNGMNYNVAIAGVSISVSLNAPHELRYNLGRFLMAVYN